MVSKNCDYGLLITANVVVGQAAVAIPNASKISWRNQLDNAWLECLKLDASNVLVVGGGPGKVAVGTPVGTVSTHLEVHGAGVADGATLLPQVRIVDTTAFAANVGGEIILGGLTDAVPTYRSFAAIKSGKANATSGNGAGYLAFWSRNASTGLLEVLRLTELQMLQVAEASDFIFGTTTGTRLGTAATQKIGFWNATPVIQSTGWGTVTGTLAKTTFVADSVTLPNLAARVGQLINDLKTYGILGG